MISSFIHHVMITGVLVIMCLTLDAQDSIAPKVVVPFDSLVVRDINSIGNAQTGGVTITMQFENRYSKPVNVHFKASGFDYFGIVDDKGNKYKIHTIENPGRTTNINKGYSNISSVIFGNDKMGDFTKVEQNLSPGESKKLTILISKINKAVNYIRDFHIDCILTLDYMYKGEEVYKIEYIKIAWKTAK